MSSASEAHSPQPTAGGGTPPGKLVVFSGPSGVGKSTLVRKLLARVGDRLRLSVSATTRPPRPGEVDGREYHFLPHEEFRRRLDAGEFLEAVEVFGRGQWYGTLWSEVTPSLAEGVWVLLEIDVDGAERTLASHPEAVSVFVMPAEDPDEALRVLESRLRGRNTEDEASIVRRLEVARREMERRDRYQHIIVNGDAISEELGAGGIDAALEALHQILIHEGLSA